MATQIVYHADLNEAQGDPALAAMPHARGPFDRPEWFALLHRECLSPKPAVLAVASDGGDVTALPLMEVAPRKLAGLANWYSFWLRPLGNSRLLPALARDLARRADAVGLSQLPEEDAVALAAAFRATGWIVESRPCDTNHFLAVAGRSFAEYWAARPGALRETVKRKGRKGIVDLEIVTAFTQADWEAYEAVYRLSWKPGEGSPAFLRGFAEAEAHAGRLRLGIARIEGKPVAAQLWTVDAGTAFIHKLAHDEASKRHSPGTLLSAALFEHVIDRDQVSEIDFGTGDDPYKADWMEGRRLRHAVTAWRPLAPSNWPAIARMAARRVLAGGP